MIKIDRDEILRYIKSTNEVGKQIEEIFYNAIIEEFEDTRCHCYINPDIMFFFINR